MDKLDRIIKNKISKITGTKDLDERKTNSIIPQCNDFIEPFSYNYLFERHKSLPSNYFEATEIPFDQNEFEVHHSKIQQSDINEGLIKTYPTDKAIDFVCSNLAKHGYFFNRNDFRKRRPNNDGTIYDGILLPVDWTYLNDEIKEILEKSFDACGYHLSTTFNRVLQCGIEVIVFQFEPKFLPNFNIPNIGDFLYHVTTANGAAKIMKKGFCPSNKNKTKIKYPSRCYFFTVYDKETFACYAAESKKKNIIDKDDFNYDFEVLTVDRRLIPNIKFYSDPNFFNDIAVFTYSNIPKTAIVGQEKL